MGYFGEDNPFRDSEVVGGLGNGTGRAYVAPRARYLATNEERRNYIHLEEDNLRTCHLIHGCHICHPTHPIYDALLVQSCEMELLRRPSLQVLRSCNIKVTYDHRPCWIPLTTLGGWLYSLATPETARLTCSGKSTQEYQLKNAGIIQMTPGCSLLTENVALPAIMLKENPHEYIYEPFMYLDLSEMSPTLVQHHQLIVLKPPSKEETEQPWYGSDADSTLSELESKLLE